MAPWILASSPKRGFVPMATDMGLARPSRNTHVKCPRSTPCDGSGSSRSRPYFFILL